MQEAGPVGLRRGWAEVLELGEVLGKMREPAGSGLGACLTGAGKATVCCSAAL